MKCTLLAVVALFVAGCGGKDAPLAPAATPASSTITLSGTLTATNGGRAISGAALDAGGQHVVTDAAGRYQLSLSPRQTSVMISGGDLVPHVMSLFVLVNTARDLDAISQSGGFDLAYYRQFLRNGLEQPTALQPLRRWTVNPSFYMKVTDEAGVTMDAKTLDNAEQTIRQMVPEWTGNHFTVAAFERGTTARSPASGWINVNWSNTSVPAAGGGFLCGLSQIGLDPGQINLYYHANQNTNRSCRCGGVSEMGARVVSHELGHAMGYFHAGAANDVMFPGTGAYCDATLSARERYHAAIAYSRPVGNRDPDTDP